MCPESILTSTPRLQTTTEGDVLYLFSSYCRDILVIDICLCLWCHTTQNDIASVSSLVVAGLRWPYLDPNRNVFIYKLSCVAHLHISV